jgi:hypothetical protein
MTTQERAAKGIAEGCHIVGKGTVKATGETVYFVAGSHGKIYSVTDAGCDCLAGRNGNPCKHAAMVSERIREERQAHAPARMPITYPPHFLRPERTGRA